MFITSEYLEQAEECERLAGGCLAKSNREILLYAAAHWRWMAKELEPSSLCCVGFSSVGQEGTW
jgi:hypothetical protein